MELIDNWLKGPKNFIVGRTLYKRFGSNEKLKALFDKGETPALKNELVKALQEILKTGDRPKPENKMRQFEAMPETEDPVLKALREEWLPLYMKMNYLRHEMDKYGTRNDNEARIACKLLAEEILMLEKRINFIWERCDHYQVHGRLPEVKADTIEIPTEGIKLAKFIQSCERQIRRYRETAATNPKHAQLLEDYKNKYFKATGKQYGEKN